jgi:hypothetical protein
MNNHYPSQGYRKPVNNFENWLFFNLSGMYEPVNDNQKKSPQDAG